MCDRTYFHARVFLDSYEKRRKKKEKYAVESRNLPAWDKRISVNWETSIEETQTKFFSKVFLKRNFEAINKVEIYEAQDASDTIRSSMCR